MHDNKKIKWVRAKTEKEFALIKEKCCLPADTENFFHVRGGIVDMFEIETKDGINLGFWYKRRFVPWYSPNWEI